MIGSAVLDRLRAAASMRLEVHPRKSVAARLSIVFWALVLSFSVPVAILTGDARSVADLLSLFSATPGAAVFSCLLFCFFVVMSGGRMLVAGLTLSLAVPLLALGQVLGDHLVQYALSTAFDLPMPALNWHAIARPLCVYWALYICHAALYWLVFVERQARVERERRSEAELAMLRLQLNPHFMMNSLGCLATLIGERRDADVAAMTGQLSEFLTLSLQASSRLLTPLEDELESAASYLEIERVRYGDRMHFKIDCPPEIGKVEVPSFLLQPLVENAVKHSFQSAQTSLHIHIVATSVAEQLSLRVDNWSDGGQPAEKAPGLGIGNANLKRRLKLLYGNRAAFSAQDLGDRYRIEVLVPLGGDRDARVGTHPN